MKFRIDKIFERVKTLDALRELLLKNPIVEIQIPIENFYRTSRDTMLDFLSLSHLAEGVAKHGKVLNGNYVFGKGMQDYFTISLTKYEIESFSKFLYLHSYVNSNEDFYSSDEHWEYIEDLDGFEDNLENTQFCFPEIIDRYYANLVNSGYAEIAQEIESMDGVEAAEHFLEIEYKKYPERYFHYWLSAHSNNCKLNVYLSKDAWIIPNKYDFTEVLVKLGEAEKKAEYIRSYSYKVNNNQIICNDKVAIWFKVSSELRHARNCADVALSKFRGLVAELSETEYYLSKYADILIVKDTFFSYVFFIHDKKLRTKEIQDIRAKLNPLHTVLGNILDVQFNSDVNWQQLDDEKFELLCYDLIYEHPKFDERTIRKMGKSKSRDGGRDITVMTKSVNGKEPELYVFQCKLLSPSSSLTKSKVPNAANVIMEYGAKGYGVFTNGIIDSTLYDMLDGFNATNGVYTRENWGKLELEKKLAEDSFLRDKYFDTS
ncbi:hypothetical protein [Winogradskyella sp.]|uniref:hypothetical protein n=1 Tax=Winogradskyella sp. TaxID=1883156 RepID=UPI002623566B|nr:hypothetical protein [Winogradskyella sp.]